MTASSVKSAAERRRIIEIAAIVITSVMLFALSRLETRLFELSESLARNHDFFTTVIYFGLINLNVFLILVLSFLLFRNVAKLVVERRRGVFGSSLRTKLVATLVFFALAPTVLLFYISSRFIITSFDEWFSEKVRITMNQTREAGARVYKQDQRRLESLARIALQRVRVLSPEEQFMAEQQLILPVSLEGFDAQYGIDSVEVFDRAGTLLWSSLVASGPPLQTVTSDPFVVEALARFGAEPGLWSLSTVVGEEDQDVVKGVAPVVQKETGQMLGIIVTQTRFETQILKSIESIQQSFSNLKPSAQLIKLSYLILLILITLLIIFSAVWLGFYVARGITGPIQRLAEGTREVALGNYRIELATRAEDETGQLVKSFNVMTQDLEKHRRQADEARIALIHSNEELDKRRKYMEVILRNIMAGVIAVDRDGVVTTVNPAAEDILKIQARRAVGSLPAQALGEYHASLWKPVQEALSTHDTFTGQIAVDVQGRQVTLLTDAVRIFDESGEDLGVVVVFDDATEEIKAQRVAAWREVARRIAHEIKNPVTPIKLSAQRLLRRFHERFEGQDQEVFESCLETILKQVDLLRDLVNEFSKFSRLPQVKPRMADINAVIIDVANLYAMSYPHVTIDTSGLGRIPEFPLDTDQMNRVFVNLVSNALAAIDEVGSGDGRVEIRSELIRSLNTVRIEVVDNGCGIPPHLFDRVLEPYYSTKDGGTGLGLAIVNQIISDHGGYLRISGHQPRGTKVVIELPVEAARTRTVLAGTQEKGS